MDRTLRLYRWDVTEWALDGTVAIPNDMPDPSGPNGGVDTVNLTASDAPNFTLHATGADTEWFAIAARVRGRWRFVPFDDQFGRRDPVVFATGVSHGLVTGLFDSCGCASGPTTDQWYRLAGDAFTAVPPPVGAAPCTAAGLAAAGHWPPVLYERLVRNVARPFTVKRFACGDGWALATDGRDVSVYEQHGRTLNAPAGRRWLRVGLGPPSLFGSEVDFAAPRSLLQRLGRAIGVRIPSGPRFPSTPPPVRSHAKTITFRVQVG